MSNQRANKSPNKFPYLPPEPQPTLQLCLRCEHLWTPRRLLPLPKTCPRCHSIHWRDPNYSPTLRKPTDNYARGANRTFKPIPIRRPSSDHYSQHKTRVSFRLENGLIERIDELARLNHVTRASQIGFMLAMRLFGQYNDNPHDAPGKQRAPNKPTK